MSHACPVCRHPRRDEMNPELTQERGAHGALRPDAEASNG
jgi:hypothetical protein